MGEAGLYARLFRYRARERRRPLEDFLTEALADLLARLPRDKLVSILEAMTGMPGAWAMTLSAQRPRFVTQVACDGGFADLVMLLDGVPALVIESKLYSGVRAHGGDDDPRNQLMTYGRWLERSRAGREPAALVLLTHATPAPPGFEDGDGYGVASRATYTWARLARRLRALATPPAEATWQTLAFELIGFLEESGMTNDTVTPSDLASARLFVPTWTRWANTLSLLWAAAGDLREGVLGKKVYEAEISVDGGMIWSWCYVVAGFPDTSYLAFAIRFPDVSDWWAGLGLPEHPHLLLMIGADDTDLSVDRIAALPGGWMNADGELVTTMPLADLPGDPDAAAAAMSTWARSRLVEARAMMLAMRG